MLKIVNDLTFYTAKLKIIFFNIEFTFEKKCTYNCMFLGKNLKSEKYNFIKELLKLKFLLHMKTHVRGM